MSTVIALLSLLAPGQSVSPQAVLDAYTSAHPPPQAWRMTAEGSGSLSFETKSARNDSAFRQSITAFGRGDARDVRFEKVTLDAAQKPTADTFMRRVISRDDQGRGFSWEVRGGDAPANGIFSPDPKDSWFTSNELQMWGGEAFVGKLGRDTEDFTKVLKQDPNLRLRPQREDVDGHSCYVLESDTPENGKYTVWLDPEAGYVPRRAVVEKGESSRFANTQLSGAGWVSARWVLDSVTVEKRGDRFVPVTFSVSEEYRAKQGHTSSGTTRFQVTVFEVNPDLKAAGAFIVDVPAGTVFRLMNFPQIAYTWTGQSVEPAVQEDVIAGLDQAVAQAGPTNAQTRTGDPERPVAMPREHPAGNGARSGRPLAVTKVGLWIGFGLVACLSAVVLGLVLRKRRRGREASA